MYSRTPTRARRFLRTDRCELQALEGRQMLATHAIADFMPFNGGDQWSYSGTLNGHSVTAVSTLSGGGTLGGFSTAKLSTVLTPTDGGAATTDNRYYAHTATGLRMFREQVVEPGLTSDVMFGPGVRIATPTVTDGVNVHFTKSLTGSSTDGRAWTGQFVGDMVIVGLENITVGAGSFEALRINLTGTVTENGTGGWTATGAVSESRWLVKGVGTVRIDYSAGYHFSDQADSSLRYNLGLTDASRLRGVTSMVVRGRGVDIAYGDTSVTAVDGTNFTGMDINGQTKTRVFTFTNTSGHAITLAGGNQGLVSITGLNAAEFVVVRQPTQTIQPGQVGIFSVRFDPATTGFRYATVSFKTTETGAQPFTFDIRGTGIILGHIQVLGPAGQNISNNAGASAGNGTVFGPIAAAGTAKVQRVFTIRNTGPGGLTLTNASRVVISGAESSAFSVTLLPASSLNAGGTSVFKIVFDPSLVGPQTALVSIYSNDWVNPVFSFTIGGTAS